MIKEIDMADFKLVYLKRGYPHCKIHGAMNKISIHADKGGYWRCICSVSESKDNCCRAGCLEIK